jgi:hypothetical protein
MKITKIQSFFGMIILFLLVGLLMIFQSEVFFALGDSSSKEVIAKHNIQFPTLPEIMQIGDSKILKVHSKTPTDFEYRWLIKYADKNWNKATSWNDLATYPFIPQQPGKYAVQVDIRQHGQEKPIVKKWLGETTVMAKLVKKVFYSPPALAIPQGTPVNFFVQPLPEFALDSLEFKLWGFYPKGWQVIYDWQSWPLPAFALDFAGHSMGALQVDIRLKKNPTIIQKIWLNSFYPYQQKQDVQPNNLLRLLLSDDFEAMHRKQAIQLLACELYLTIHLLLWEYKNLPIQEQVTLIGQLSWIEEMNNKGKAIIQLDIQEGDSYDIDLNKRTFRETHSPIQIHISLQYFTEYRKIFEQLNDYSEQAKILAAVTYAVYTGYQYGTAPNYIVENISDSIAHCGTSSLHLHEILKAMVQKSSLVGIGAPSKSHMILESSTNKGETFLLDTSAGFIYHFSASDLGKKEIPQPIRLPQVRNLDFLDLRQFIEDIHSTSISIYQDYKEGVMPPQLKSN